MKRQGTGCSVCLYDFMNDRSFADGSKSYCIIRTYCWSFAEKIPYWPISYYPVGHLRKWDYKMNFRGVYIDKPEIVVGTMDINHRWRNGPALKDMNVE